MSILVATPDGQTAQFPDGTDPGIIKAAMAKQFGGPKQASEGFTTADANPTSGNSLLQNLAAGTGQGMTDAVLGAAQLGAHNPIIQLVQSLTGKNLSGYLDQAAKDKAKLDAPILDTGGGKVGSTLGNVAATAPLAMIAGPGTGLLKAASTAALQGAGAGAVQPVASDNYDATKAAQIGMGAGVGGVGGGVLSLLGKAAGAVLQPGATTLNAAGIGSKATPFAQEGEALAQRTGIDFRPSEITGSAQQAGVESYARQSIFSRNKVFDSDSKVAQQWVDHVNSTLDNISPDATSSGDIGQRIQGVVKNATNDITSRRNALAAQEFGDIRNITKGAATIEPTATNDALQQIVTDYGGVGSPSADSLAAFAKKQLANVAPGSQSGLNDIDKAAISQFGGVGNMTPDNIATAEKWSPGIGQRLQGTTNQTAPAQGNLDNLMKLRQYVSQVAGGQAKISGDNIDRKVAAQLLGTIDTDINSAAESMAGTPQAPLGAMLKQANAHYADFSQKIEGLQNSAVGKLVGKDFADAMGNGTFNQIPGATVAERFGNLTPEEITASKNMISQYEPDTWQAVKRNYFEDALAKSQQMAPSLGANTAAANPGKFINEIGNKPEDLARLNAMLDPSERTGIQDTLDAARRLAGRVGYNTSGTGPWIQMTALMSAIPRFLMGDVTVAPQLYGQVVAPRSIANVMLNSQGRASVQRLAQLPPGSAGFRDQAAKLAAIAAGQSVDAPAQGN